MEHFFGEYYYRVDRGRVPNPPRCWRRFQAITLTYNRRDGCIAGIPSPTGLSLDARGRISISKELRELAGIRDSLIILATEEYLEFWGEMNWQLEEALATRAAGLLPGGQVTDC